MKILHRKRCESVTHLPIYKRASTSDVLDRSQFQNQSLSFIFCKSHGPQNFNLNHSSFLLTHYTQNNEYHVLNIHSFFRFLMYIQTVQRLLM